MSGLCINCYELVDFVEDYSSGDISCPNCSAVQREQVIDKGKEWRDFENDAKGIERSRAEKVDEDFQSLGTGISTSNYGSNAASATAKQLSKYSKLADTAESKSEQYLKDIFIRLNELCELLQIPTLIKETAKDFAKKFEKKRNKHMKNCKKDAFIVALLLIACKQEQGGRTLKGFSRATQVDEKDIKRFYKLLLREVEIQNKKPTSNEVQELVDVFCTKLQLPFAVAKEAKELAAQSLNFLEGKRPSSIAAACILFIMHLLGLPHKQQELATIAGISANTLRNVHKELTNHVDKLPAHLFQLQTPIAVF